MEPSVLKKLQWKSPGRALVVAPPEEFAPVLAAMDDVDTRPRGRYRFAIVFLRTARDVAVSATSVARRLDGDGVFWAAYPKKTSRRYASTLSRDAGWTPLGQLGFEPVAQVALDEDWSALRFRKVEAIPVLTRARTISGEGRARTDRAAGSVARSSEGEGRDRTDRDRAVGAPPRTKARRTPRAPRRAPRLSTANRTRKKR